MNPVLHFDTIIIGSGLAAFTAALHLASHQRVALVTKAETTVGASWLAQGGIVGMLGFPDSLQAHVRDTMVAGCFLNDPDAVARYSRESAEAANWLQYQGVPFTADDTGLPHLTREGGHSHRRILHVADHTGFSIQDALLAKVRQSNATVLEHLGLVQLLVNEGACSGALVQDTRTGAGQVIRASAVVIATGGVGQLFERTVAPATITGDGIAACWAAGCGLANMEFIQFHPTGLYAPGHSPFLISEAVRGEGGHLLNAAGERFMQNYDSRLELAPRDIVARSILSEMTRHQAPCAYLDVRHLGKDFILHHFPMIYENCLERGINILSQPIPVAPITHYTCGGVQVDSNAQTAVSGLYCIGEAAYTGLHGANRLASNSLLECVVDGMAAAHHIQHQPKAAGLSHAVTDQRVAPSAELLHRAEVVRAQLRLLMWRSAGLIRDDQKLSRALEHIQSWWAEFFPTQQPCWTGTQLQELYSLLVCARAVLVAALQRRDSIGCHFRADFPDAPANLIPSVLHRIP